MSSGNNNEVSTNDTKTTFSIKRMNERKRKRKHEAHNNDMSTSILAKANEKKASKW